MAKSSNKWLERYTDGGLYIPLEGTSYVVRQQISKPRTYGDGGKYLTVNGEYHRVYENAEGDIMVNHPKEDKGKWDTINLTQKAKAKTIAQGIAATKKWHRENPEYTNGGWLNQYEQGGINPLEADIISKVIMQRNKDKDFVKRAYAVGEYPESNMFQRNSPNDFGEKESHLMSWGTDDEGQAWMYPSIFNPNNEAIKVPNEYADYISSIGYKKATGIKYEEGGYADDSAVLNTEGQEVNTMQFALPTVPTFNFGNGDGDGEDPKDKKKSKDKKTDTRTIGQKRHDALEAAKTKILKTESPENKKKMDMLYSTTIAAENTYGYDPNAYGRKKQTRSPMSIDNIALDELFNPKGEKNRYTLQQKLNFDLLRSLGLPTDKAKLKELLETDDAYAGLGAAKTLYYNEGALKNLPNPTDTAAYINLYLNEYNKSGALKYQKRNELIDNITNKMRAEGKRKTKTIKPVVKNKTTK